MPSFSSSSPKDLLILGRERECYIHVRERYQSVASHSVPTRDGTRHLSGHRMTLQPAEPAARAPPSVIAQISVPEDRTCCLDPQLTRCTVLCYDASPPVHQPNDLLLLLWVKSPRRHGPPPLGLPPGGHAPSDGPWSLPLAFPEYSHIHI